MFFFKEFVSLEEPCKHYNNNY